MKKVAASIFIHYATYLLFPDDNQVPLIQQQQKVFL